MNTEPIIYRTKGIVSFSLILVACSFVIAYSSYTLAKVYKNFKTKDMTLFLTSLSHIISSVVFLALIATGLAFSILISYDEHRSKYFINITRALTTVYASFISIGL
jgi:hypothetical protein